MPRFSILTVTLNAAKYLEETLASVATQTFTDIEHIVFDGGSNDNTLEIAASFPHVKIIQGSDRGLSDAMNQAAAAASGDYLLHLHADDRLAHSAALSFVDTALRQHPTFQWLYGQVEVIDKKSSLVKVLPFCPYSRKRLLKYNIISHPATFISKDLFSKVGGFDLSLNYAMDYDLWLRLSALCPPFALPAVLSSFREHKGSLSTSLPLKVADEAYLVRSRYLSCLWDRFKSYRTWKRRVKALRKVT